MVCTKLTEIGPVVLEKKKMWKVYDNDNDDNDNDKNADDNDDGQMTNCYQKNSLEPSAQMS